MYKGHARLAQGSEAYAETGKEIAAHPVGGREELAGAASLQRR